MSNITVNIKRLDPTVELPKYAHSTDASGLAIKQGLSIVNTPGLIDAHYRGELKVILINLDPTNNIQINKGDRIAQLVIQEVPTVNLVEVEELDETDRGKGGFGSSGVA